jgi:hypothetical protein
MIVDEVLELTRERIKSIVAEQPSPSTAVGDDRRSGPRWPVGGLVELWDRAAAAGASGYGTCREISEGGIGIQCSRSFEVGASVMLALHLPDVAMQGRGTVRYCAPCERGYSVGVEFGFIG